MEGGWGGRVACVIQISLKYITTILDGGIKDGRKVVGGVGGREE